MGGVWRWGPVHGAAGRSFSLSLFRNFLPAQLLLAARLLAHRARRTAAAQAGEMCQNVPPQHERRRRLNTLHQRCSPPRPCNPTVGGVNTGNTSTRVGGAPPACTHAGARWCCAPKRSATPARRRQPRLTLRRLAVDGGLPARLDVERPSGPAVLPRRPLVARGAAVRACGRMRGRES